MLAYYIFFPVAALLASSHVAVASPVAGGDLAIRDINGVDFSMVNMASLWAVNPHNLHDILTQTLQAHASLRESQPDTTVPVHPNKDLGTIDATVHLSFKQVEALLGALQGKVSKRVDGMDATSTNSALEARSALSSKRLCLGCKCCSCKHSGACCGACGKCQHCHCSDDSQKTNCNSS